MFLQAELGPKGGNREAFLFVDPGYAFRILGKLLQVS